MEASGGAIQNRLLGIVFRIGAASSFALMAAMIKLGHEAHIPLAELIFYRFAFGLPPLLAWIALTGNFSAWRTKRPGAHIGRAVLGLSTMVLGFSALAFLPLAESTTISFVAPLFAVMLSALVLGEKVGPYRWSAVALGFIGVLIVIQPGGTDLSPIRSEVYVKADITSGSVGIEQPKSPFEFDGPPAAA